MEQEVYHRFSYENFVSLPRYNMYIKLLIDGSESSGFSSGTQE